MANHPNRAWRAKMQRACDAWLSKWKRPAGCAFLLSADDMADVMRNAYLSGYAAGRESMAYKPPKAQT